LASIEKTGKAARKTGRKPEYEKHFGTHLRQVQGNVLARLFKADKRSS
jgi:hypothetical protein